MADLDKMALLPCPFCGGKPRTGTANSGVPGMEDCGYAYIECCDVHVHRDEDEECAAAWNRRTALLTAPPGWKLVPELADDAMLSAGFPRNEIVDGCFDRQGAWTDMLAAAPEVK